MTNNYCVRFAKRPGAGTPTPEIFTYQECEYPQVKDNEILIKTLFLSTDPVQRFQIREDSGIPGLAVYQINEIVSGLNGVGVVVESKSSKFKDGDIVINTNTHWPGQNYWCVLGDSGLVATIKSSEPEHEIAYYGVPGLTALLGLQIQGKLDTGKGIGKTIVISGAAGSCGHLAGQFARVYGCDPVIGIACCDEKCTILKDELKFTDCINYKTENVEERIKALCPKGVDIYFDNFGGSISDAVVSHMNKDTHIVLCGQYKSQYSKGGDSGNGSELVSKMCEEKNIFRVPFLVLNLADKFPSARETLYKMKHEDGVKVWQTIYEGLENMGKAFCDMFGGKNVGKMMIKVGEQ